MRPASLSADVIAQRPHRPRAEQPLEVLNIDGALLQLSTLSRASGLSLPTLYRAAKEQRLELVKHGKRCTRVRSEEARRFIASLGS